MISQVLFTSEQPKGKQNGFCRYIFTNKVTLWVAIYSACVVYTQGAKKVVSDNPGLVDFAIGLVNSVLSLPDEQAKIFR